MIRILVLCWTAVFFLATCLASTAFSQADEGESEVTLLVTVVAHNERTRAIAAKLQPEDFAVYEEEQPRKILQVSKAENDPVTFALLIQDNLVTRVNNELRDLKKFITRLPEGSKVMIAYVSRGSLEVRQEFTTDRELAISRMRIIPGTGLAAPYSPYVLLKEAVGRFRGQPNKRRMVLMVTDGVDNDGGFHRISPFFSAYLDGAVSAAQRERVAVYSIFAPTSAGLGGQSRRTVNTGQGALLRLADLTGGEAFSTGSDFVTFDPYLRELNEIFSNQWLLTYESAATNKVFRKIEVTTDFNIELHHLAGYQVN